MRFGVTADRMGGIDQHSECERTMSITERSDEDIQRDVLRMAGDVGIPLTVSVDKGVVTLEGVVLTEEERQAAIDLTSYVAGVVNIVERLEVMEFEADHPDALLGRPTRPDEWDPGTEPDDFGELSVSLDEIATADAGRVQNDWTTDERVAIQDGATYFPPTDPPTDLSDDPEGIEVASGFQSTSLDDNILRPDEDDIPGYIDVRDGEIVDNVVRELNEDASTTHLSIHVASVRGTVFLTGYVSDPYDSDNAAAVAERVPGVREVVDRLVVGEPPAAEPPRRIRGVRRAREGRIEVPSPSWRATVARNERWLRAERDRVVEQIEARREELAQIGRYQADEGSVSNHQGDVASDVTAAATLNTEIVNLEDELNAIDEALRRIEDGSYGICLTCGRLIDPARLRAFPLAVRDVEHQRLYDEEQGAALQAEQSRGLD